MNKNLYIVILACSLAFIGCDKSGPDRETPNPTSLEEETAAVATDTPAEEPKAPEGAKATGLVEGSSDATGICMNDSECPGENAFCDTKDCHSCCPPSAEVCGNACCGRCGTKTK